MDADRFGYHSHSVCPLVVVVSNQFNESRVEHDASGGIQDAGATVSVEVHRDHRLVSHADNLYIVFICSV